MTEDRETFGALVTIQPKTGDASVYSQYDFAKIIERGCKELGFKCTFSHVSLPVPAGAEHQFMVGVNIEPEV